MDSFSNTLDSTTARAAEPKEIRLENSEGQQCRCSNIWWKEIADLKDNLPEEYQYKVCEFKKIKDKHWEAILRLPLTTVEEVQQWKKRFEEKSYMTFTVMQAWPASPHNLLKKKYCCHHNTRPRSKTADTKKGSKNTRCPTKMVITLKEGYSRRSKEHLRDHHLTIKINNCHNHPIKCADSLKKRNVGEDVAKKLLGLMERCHSPTTAILVHKYNLMEELGDDYIGIADDRKHVPDRGFVYNLYYKTFRKQYHDEKDKVVDTLRQLVTSLNSGHESPVAKMDQTFEGDSVVAIYHPVMRRASQKLMQCRDMVMVDAHNTGIVKRGGCWVYLMRTHLYADCIPLGCLIASNENVGALSTALKLYTSMLTEQCYFGRGSRGPHIFFTSSNDSLRTALGCAFPEARLIISTYHILTDTWQWLWEAKNNIGTNDRQHLFSLAKALVTAEDSESFNFRFKLLVEDYVCCRYETFIEYIYKFCQSKETWLLFGGNYSELSTRVFKQRILLRLKGFNMAQVFDFISVSYTGAIKSYLVDLSKNLVKQRLFAGHYQLVKFGQLERILKIDEDNYIVPSETEFGVSYGVDINVGVCSCSVGINGTPCEHQGAVHTKFGIPCYSSLLEKNGERRKILYYIATGEDAWYIHLQTPHLCPTPCAFDVDDVAKRSTVFFDRVREKMRTNNSIFEAFSQFVQAAERLESDQDLISALSNFAKESESPRPDGQPTEQHGSTLSNGGLGGVTEEGKLLSIVAAETTQLNKMKRGKNTRRKENRNLTSRSIKNVESKRSNSKGGTRSRVHYHSVSPSCADLEERFGRDSLNSLVVAASNRRPKADAKRPRQGNAPSEYLSTKRRKSKRVKVLDDVAEVYFDPSSSESLEKNFLL